MTREQIENAIKCCNPYDEDCGSCPFKDLPLGDCFEMLAITAFNMLLEDRELLQKQVNEYKDKLAQGKLIELPCKVGDTLYFIYNRPHADKPMIDPKIYETKDWYFDIDGKGVAILPRSIREYNGEYFYYLQETVFLTREEAEKKLEELRK